MRHTTLALIAVVLLTTLAAPQAQTPRAEPIRAQSGPSPARFASLDVADGSFAVFGIDDVYARHLGVSDMGVERLQVTERVQILPVSGGDPTRAQYVCATHEGVLFGSPVPCGDVRLQPERR